MRIEDEKGKKRVDGNFVNMMMVVGDSSFSITITDTDGYGEGKNKMMRKRS